MARSGEQSGSIKYAKAEQETQHETIPDIQFEITEKKYRVYDKHVS